VRGFRETATRQALKIDRLKQSSIRRLEPGAAVERLKPLERLDPVVVMLPADLNDRSFRSFGNSRDVEISAELP
jgi:hypothetical protein